MVSIGRGPEDQKKRKVDPATAPTGKSYLDQLGLGPTEQGKRGGLGGITTFFSSKNTGDDAASVKARKVEDDRVASDTLKIRKQANAAPHGPRGGYTATEPMTARPAATPPAASPKRVTVTKRATPRAKTTTVTSEPKTYGFSKPARAEAPVHNWRGSGSEPQKKQRAALLAKGSSGAHDTKGLKWFK